jgi:pyrroloquinoline quinone (PQQ) biosynthesis protein C
MVEGRMRVKDNDSAGRTPEQGPRPLPPAPEIVDAYERREVADHSFFCSLRSAPVDLEAIWILVANLQAGISRDFIRWLATTIDRVDDRRIASLLAKQLNDELGNGAFNQIHSRLLEQFVSGLDPWRPKAMAESRLLAPGRRLAEGGSTPFSAPDAYEAVGALIVGEIFAKKMDRCLGDEIRRQGDLSAHTLTWLTLHEVLEVDHADDSRELAELVPNEGSALHATWRGATAQWQALWQFLDEVHEVTVALHS